MKRFNKLGLRIWRGKALDKSDKIWIDLDGNSISCVEWKNALKLVDHLHDVADALENEFFKLMENKKVPCKSLGVGNPATRHHVFLNLHDGCDDCAKMKSKKRK